MNERTWIECHWRRSYLFAAIVSFVISIAGGVLLYSGVAIGAIGLVACFISGIICLRLWASS